MKIILTAALILSFIFVFGCNHKEGDSPEKTKEAAVEKAIHDKEANVIEIEDDSKTLNYNVDYPADFEFSLKYGINARNDINTFDDTFTKDLISAGTAECKMQLTTKEKREIYREMERIGFLKYPELFTPKENGGVDPYNSYYFRVRVNGEIKEVTWIDQGESQEYKALELRNLIKKIVKTIQNGSEYKQLPNPQGGYS